jgi:hypothetical protein
MTKTRIVRIGHFNDLCGTEKLATKLLNLRIVQQVWPRPITSADYRWQDRL